jgi:hypothetical protein
MTESKNSTESALVVCGLWLHSGFIGAVALAAGLLELCGGEASLWALGVAFFGGALAVASWRHARTVLEHAYPKQTRPGAITMMSSIPLQSNRRRDVDLCHSTPE